MLDMKDMICSNKQRRWLNSFKAQGPKLNVQKGKRLTLISGVNR